MSSYTRHVTDSELEGDSNFPTLEPGEQRFELYRLCECPTCEGTGKIPEDEGDPRTVRCIECRGEGKVRENVAGADTELGLAQAILVNGREGAWEGCPFGLLDRFGEPGQKWLVTPWLPSARNVSDAGRVLAAKRHGKGESNA